MAITCLVVLVMFALGGWVAWIVRDVPSTDEIRAAFVERSGAKEVFVYDPRSVNLSSPEAIIPTFNPRPLYDVNVCGTPQSLDPAAMPVSENFVKLLLASEDNNFCLHRGYDLRGIVVAVMEYVRGAMTGERGRMRGASTITQQLAKNAACYIQTDARVRPPDEEGMCDNERSLDRKIREIWIATRIESTFSKDEILALYLNSVRFWGRHQGLALASWRFFRATPDDLTLAQSALLVGALKATTGYSPTQNWDRALGQAAGVVLPGSRQKQTNADPGDDHLAITEAELLQARAELAPPHRAGLYHEAPWFAENVFVGWLRRSGLAAAQDASEDGKVRWVTTLDRRIQARAEEVARAFFEEGETSASPASQIRADAMSIVVLDRTGAIRAMIGGQRATSDRTDRATRRKRPPGSTIKPLVYALALQNGCAPGSLIEDRPLDQPGDPTAPNGEYWNPRNAGGGYAGDIALRTALKQSSNTTAVQLGDAIRLDGRVGMEALDHALQTYLAISIIDRRPGAEGRRRQNALGVRPMSPLDVAVTFLPYLNEGRAVQVRGLEAVDRIRSDGQVIRTRYTPVSAPFLSPPTASAMIGMLHGVVNDNDGTGRQARVAGLDVIGKTGTTNDFRDAWFVGATNDLVAVVWVGRDDGRPMAAGTFGGAVAARLWAEVMSRIYESDRIRPKPPSFSELGWDLQGPDRCINFLRGEPADMPRPEISTTYPKAKE